MKIGPKYKIARRLGNSVFEKTSGPKFALREQNKKGRRIARPRSNFGIQLIEKQKVRFTYGVLEKQFSKYVRESLKKSHENPAENLFATLERRLDNVVLRSSFVPTRQAAKQAVSHGHILVNGKKNNVPSHQVKEGDVITIKEKSREKGLWSIAEAQDLPDTPKWLSVNLSKKEIKVAGTPNYIPSESNFDLSAVIQYYKR